MYALIDNNGTIEDGFNNEHEARDKFSELCEDGFEFFGVVRIVQIIDNLT